MPPKRKTIDTTDELIAEAKAWANREMFRYQALNQDGKIPDRVDIVVRLVKEIDRLRGAMHGAAS
jgi:hypothetical protein